MILRVERLAVELGVSARTIDHWYRWKRKNPNHPLAELLPDYTKVDGYRVWKTDDIDSIKVFMNSRPMGRNGIMSNKKE